ncbi:MAG TPA: hypothetical protein ENN65_03365, partial [Candidatus Hydrogenedentes bacterium]|nr:hypothetical protein [Candidatus Hydrogenedentota bacterium]
MLKRFLQSLLALLGTAALLLAVVAWQYFIGHNFRTVEKGAFYGSRQMSGAALERTIRKYDIKTVINLRGENTDQDWYREETAACRRAGVAHISFGWSKNRLPPPESLARFVMLIEEGKKPFLAHCEGGTHRTGVAAAVYLLLRGESPDSARGQFGPMFKDAPIGELVTLYEQSDLPFRQWVLEAYPAIY